ncbi:D-alanyl-D-alanine carboxypeptidase [Desertibaculum subflavum]|uniref:D-alanyl-D-alanine carboxypeptidase n=1 Tax=Desertibaculum subflavum TaxID=2268458 RepID=UPI000E66B0D3
MRRLMVALLVTLLAASGAWAKSAPSKKSSARPQVDNRTASILIDAETGAVLHGDREDELRYPASLTKIMTLYLVFEALESGRLKLHQRLHVSGFAAGQEPSKLGLKPGETITVEAAILGVVTKSANDAAVVLAEGVARSESAFAELMTAKARELGMSSTVFQNASGLPNSAQQTTARDMAALGAAMVRDHPRYYPYFSRESFSFDGVAHANHNKLLSRYDGVDGIKTGFIRASGFNLVASAVRDGRRLVGVVFGGNTASVRDAQMVKLLDAGFRDSSTMVAGNSSKLRAVVARAAKAVNPISTAQAATDEKASGRGGYAVQVGAFGRAQAAEQVARKAAKLVPQLDEKDAYVDRDGRSKYFRARVGGLSLNEAREACRVLKSKGQDCLVVGT